MPSESSTLSAAVELFLSLSSNISREFLLDPDRDIKHLQQRLFISPSSTSHLCHWKLLIYYLHQSVWLPFLLIFHSIPFFSAVKSVSCSMTCEKHELGFGERMWQRAFAQEMRQHHTWEHMHALQQSVHGHVILHTVSPFFHVIAFLYIKSVFLYLSLMQSCTACPKVIEYKYCIIIMWLNTAAPIHLLMTITYQANMEFNFICFFLKLLLEFINSNWEIMSCRAAIGNQWCSNPPKSNP